MPAWLPRSCSRVAARPGAQASTDASAGGIFRVSFQGSSSLQAFDHVDPALAYSRESWTLLDTVCARLMRYRDKPPPAGYTLVPEVAAAPPTVSPDGRTTTFKLREGFFFSNGTPVRADAFAHAIDRTMAPGVDSPAWLYTQAIVGAADVKTGKRSRAAGVTARGNTLTVRFSREVRDFGAWTTMPFFCAVPPTLPASAEGVRTFPGAGPYTIREYRPNQRIRISRNPHYRGNRATTSTASTSTSAPPHPRKCSTESKPARPTGATRHPHPSSSRDTGSSASTASTTTGSR